MLRQLLSALHPPPYHFRKAVITMTTQPVISTQPVVIPPAVIQPTSIPGSPPRPGKFYRRLLPSSCIAFNSLEGRGVFREALETGYMEGYFGLAAQFRTQDEPAFCGLSTLVMVLNTLEVDPQRVWKGVWRWYHENMLDCCVPLEDASTKGITMDEFACIASCNALNVNMVRANDDASEDDFRSLVKKITQCIDEVAVVSYSRAVLDQTGDGHFSPVGGYHPGLDLVLVLDTARFKYPPHWVSLPLLFQAMKACDKDTGLPRGYLRLRRSQKVPLVLFRWSDAVSQQLLDVKSQTTPSSTGFQKFLESWNSWLLQPSPPGGAPIMESAVHFLMNALTLQNESILATQFNACYLDMLSTEHSCLVKELLQSMESLPIYATVEEYLSKNPQANTLPWEMDIVCRKSVCASGTESRREVGGGGNSDTQEEPIMAPCTTCEVCLLKLQASHYLTILLLAWPTQKCGGNCSNELRKAVSSQLCCAHAILQDEVAQLTQQLSTLMQHQEKCTNCHCGKAC